MLASNYLCSQRWPWTLDLPASASSVLSLQVYTTLPSFIPFSEINSYLPTHPPIYSPTYLSLHLPTFHLPIYPPTHLLTNLCTYLPTYQPTYPPVCLSIYWSLSILCFLSFDREGFISFSNKFQYILPQRLQGYIIILIFRFSKKNFKPRTFRHSLWYSVSVIQGMASDCQWVGLYFVEEKEVLL